MGFSCGEDEFERLEDDGLTIKSAKDSLKPTMSSSDISPTTAGSAFWYLVTKNASAAKLQAPKLQVTRQAQWCRVGRGGLHVARATARHECRTR